MTILWSLAAGVAMTLVVVCGAVWLINRRDPASLLLCCQGVAAAIAAYLELRMMQATTTAQYGELLRWYHLPVFLAIISQILFVRYYLGTGRNWLLGTFIAARCVILIVDFTVDPNFNFSSITALHQVPLFGDQVTAIAAAVTRSGWQKFASAAFLLWVAFLTDAAIQRWRMADRESKRKTIAVIAGIAIPMGGTIVYSQLLAFGLLRVPLSNLPWFLGALILMAIELGRDFVVGRRALDQLAELQSQLARTERINTVGQLASAIIHELTQPLSASVLNAETALHFLKRTPPDTEELRAILDDIKHDGQRGTEVISRMRQFAGQHKITMQPLQIDEWAKDVISMVRPKAASDKITLSLLLPPDPPYVMGDRVHLSQVLLNLLMNSMHAVQSCPSNARKIVVEVQPGPEEVQISVRDSGTGISQDIAQKLFTPFVTTKPDGMGMGLTLSRTIVEAHGGKLWAEGMNKQDGAVFCFTLRRA